MISEEMLKKAAAEADQAIRDSLPAPAECEHEFSQSFQRKMRRTFRKAKHPVIYKLPKYAACFVLAVALASGTWLTVDAEARTAFFAWVREQYESFVEYTPNLASSSILVLSSGHNSGQKWEELGKPCGFK